MVSTKNTQDNKYWWGCGETGTLTQLVGMQNSMAAMENSM
jgi:hypothetical protein